MLTGHITELVIAKDGFATLVTSHVSSNIVVVFRVNATR